MKTEHHKLLIIQNDPTVPPGLLGDYLRENAVPNRVVKVFAGEKIEALEGIRALVVLGGTPSVYDTERYPFLREVRRSIEEALAKEIPFLGICLGGQLLAQVLGGEVHRNRNGEIGFCTLSLTDHGREDPVFKELPGMFTTFQWHNDSFVAPEASIHLAESASCPYQAFRWGKSTYGIQFHPEATLEIIDEWSSQESEIQARLRSEFGATEAVFRSTSTAFFRNFLQILRTGHT